jgi:hypothetical protein
MTKQRCKRNKVQYSGLPLEHTMANRIGQKTPSSWARCLLAILQEWKQLAANIGQRSQLQEGCEWSLQQKILQAIEKDSIVLNQGGWI